MPKRKTKEEIIEMARKVHGDKYDYSKVKYVNGKTKMEIICPIHGSFWQTPNGHINKTRGCRKCAYITVTNTQRKSEEEIIEMARKVHGDKYEYPNFKYKNNKIKIEIVCPYHGSFWQPIKDHVYKKCGCPYCQHLISKLSQKWLDSLNVPQERREITLKIEGRKFRLDAFDEKNGIAYEFNGDFWHGNPKMFNPNDINPCNKTTYGELHRKTLEKKAILEKAGYKVISIWENDFKEKDNGSK